MQMVLGTQRYRVLIVSQNPLICFSLQNIFSDSDISVTTATSREAGAEQLRKQKFDAVISEVCSDVNEGLLFRQTVRLLDEMLPILFVTPVIYWSDVKLLDRVVEDPHSYYIPENADRVFMLAKLKQVVNSYQAEKALETLKSRITRNWYLASLLQHAMLPPWVYFCDSYEFSYLYRPFTRVSGDLFEWLPLDADRALFIFGDVSGHGTHSALAMSAVQAFLKQIVLGDKEKARHPCVIATEINDFFCNHLHNIVYMSTLIAYVDFKKNYFCYQNAGYMDIICVEGTTGEVIDVNPDRKGNLPLGMVKDAVYTADDDVEYHFTDSTAFLFFSDGLMDLSKDREGDRYVDMDTFRKLVSFLVVEAQKEEKAIAIPFHCYHKLKQFGYTHPQDDISMVLLRKPLHLEKEDIFACRAPADNKSVDQICERASHFVEQYYNDERLSVNAELLLGEYLTNIVMHGLNEYEKLNEYIAVKLCAGDEGLRIIIWDHGKEWNGLLIAPQQAETTLDELNDVMSESGRGLPIISKIASRVSRQRFSNLNETIFVIPYHKERQ